MLPKVPDWKSKKITLLGYATREPMYLFFHNALDCMKNLFGNPLFAEHMDFSPTRLYHDAEQTMLDLFRVDDRGRRLEHAGLFFGSNHLLHMVLNGCH